jgi:hypothetical protein
MTFKKFKNLTAGLLTGDNVLPKDDDVTLALLDDAFTTISDKAEALHLLTMNQSEAIARLAVGDYLSRVPNLPVNDEDELDIDEELCSAAARLVAAMLSKNKPRVHEAKAAERIADYNSKVYQLMESAKEQEGGECGISK